MNRLRLYGALLRLLPPDARDDADDIRRTFGRMLEDAADGRARLRLTLRVFGRLPGVLALEWLEFLGVRRAPGRTRRGGTMGLGRNVQYAVRTLLKAPSFTLSALLLVVVGVGAVTTIFTLVDHVLLRPLPYPAAERLVILENGSHSGPFFRAVREMESFESIGAARTSDVTLVGEGDPLRLRQASVSTGFFDFYGARAARGHLLGPNDTRESGAVVLDGGAWIRIWGGDPGVVGRTVDVDGERLTVVGVLDPAFTPPLAQVGRTPDVWRPLDWGSEALRSHEFWILQIVGRLRPGLDAAAATAELAPIRAALADEHENYRNEDGTPRDMPVTSLAEVTVRGVRTGLGLLLGAVGLLLLVACVNVAHLFLARGLGRRREMAVRRAVGAGTGTLVSQLLVEALTVGVVGGLAGAAAAWAGVSAFVSLYPDTLPRAAEIGVDVRVLLFAVGVSMATALAFGLLPALRSVGRDPADELRGGGRPTSSGRGVARLRNVLVTAEVALSLMLVASAGLLLRSFLLVRSQDSGLVTANVWTVPLTPTEIDTPEAYRALMDGVREAALATPGVLDAGYGLTLPLEGGGRCCWRSSMTVDGADVSAPFLHPVSEGYFSTLGIELVAGRVWTAAEAVADPWPVVLAEPYAVEVFGSAEAALGRALTQERGEQSVMQVVGVAREIRQWGLDEEQGPALYLPMEHLPFPIDLAHLAVMAAPGAASSMPRALRSAVWSVAPRLPVPTVRRMEEWLAESTASRRFGSVVFGAFATIALLLAAGGVYGTLLFTASQRRKEVGIRLTLGATRRGVEGHFVRSALAVGTLGVALGLAGARISGRLLESQVWGVGRGDPMTLAGSALLLMATIALASWLPARSAGGVDPVETLRAE